MRDNNSKNSESSDFENFFNRNIANSFLVLIVHFQKKNSLFWHTQPKVKKNLSKTNLSHFFDLFFILAKYFFYSK